MDNLILPSEKGKNWFLGAKKLYVPPQMIHSNELNDIIRNFYFTAVGYYPKAVDHGINRADGCDQYIFIYCVEGSGVIQIESTTFTIRQHMAFIIPKNTPHLYYSSTRTPWSIYWIHFCGKMATELFKRSLKGNQLQPLLIQYDKQKIELFKRTFDLLEKGYTERALEIASLNLLYIVSSIVYQDELHSNSTDSNTAKRSISYMTDQIQRMVTIKELAQQQNISVSYYSRLFKRYTGQSPLHYFMQLKIQTSCNYLSFTNKSIKEIANLLGFDDPFYFSRLFTTSMGMSPKKYRFFQSENQKG